MVARCQEYLYLAGVLFSGVSILFWLHFTSSIFGESATIFKFELRWTSSPLSAWLSFLKPPITIVSLVCHHYRGGMSLSSYFHELTVPSPLRYPIKPSFLMDLHLPFPMTNPGFDLSTATTPKATIEF